MTDTDTPKRYPPGAAELWDRCVLAGTDPDARAWLQSEHLPMGAVEDFDLAKVLPDGDLPPWALGWRAHHRLVTPLYDHTGVVRSLQPRLIGTRNGPPWLRPKGFAASGLIMANPTGLAILQGMPWTGRDLALVWGTVPFLAAACDSGENLDAPAMFGITSHGAWTPAMAAGVPDGTQVDVSRVDERFRDDVVATLTGRVRITGEPG